MTTNLVGVIMCHACGRTVPVRRIDGTDSIAITMPSGMTVTIPDIVGAHGYLCAMLCTPGGLWRPPLLHTIGTMP